jgi:hypothetical protein
MAGAVAVVKGPRPAAMPSPGSSRPRAGALTSARPARLAAVLVLVVVIAGALLPLTAAAQEASGASGGLGGSGGPGASGGTTRYTLDYDRDSATERLLAPDERAPMRLEDFVADPDEVPDARRRGLRTYPREPRPEEAIDVPSAAVPQLRQERRRVQGRIDVLDRRLEETAPRGSTRRESAGFPVGQDRRNAQMRPQWEAERRALAAERDAVDSRLDALQWQNRTSGGGSAGRTQLQNQLQRLRQR